MQKGNYEGGRPSLGLKTEHEAQSVLIGADPSDFFAPPYVGNKGRIGVYLDGRSIDWDELTELVEDSYRLIAPKRLASQVEAD